MLRNTARFVLYYNHFRPEKKRMKEWKAKEVQSKNKRYKQINMRRKERRERKEHKFQLISNYILMNCNIESNSVITSKQSPNFGIAQCIELALESVLSRTVS
jgi:hypothetical protein